MIARMGGAAPRFDEESVKAPTRGFGAADRTAARTAALLEGANVGAGAGAGDDAAAKAGCCPKLWKN